MATSSEGQPLEAATVAADPSGAPTTTTPQLSEQQNQLPPPPPSSAAEGDSPPAAAVEQGEGEDEEALLPTPRSSGSSSFLFSASFRPRIEEPSTSANPNSNHNHHSANNSSRDEPVSTPKRPAVAAPSPSSTEEQQPLPQQLPKTSIHSNNSSHNRNRSKDNNHNPRLGLPPDGEGTTASNKYFLSEPSLSPDDDSEDESRIRAPHRLPFAGGRAFHRHVSSSEDDGGNQNLLYYHPHRFAQASPVPSSPGNTSLSSWDSPSRSKHRVLLQFTPSAFRSGNNSTPIQNFSGMSSAGGASQPQQQTQGTTQQPQPSQSFVGGAERENSNSNGGGVSGISPDDSRGVSPSLRTPPTTRKQFLEEEVANGNSTTGGGGSGGGSSLTFSEPSLPLPALKELQPAAASAAESNNNKNANDSTPNSANSSFRRLMDGLKDADSVSDSLVFDPSLVAAGPATSSSSNKRYPRIRVNGHHHHQNHFQNHNNMEESIVMDLSDSEDEIIVNNSHVRIPPLNQSTNGASHQYSHPHHVAMASRTSTFDSEYMQDQAADDEKTATTTDADLADADKKMPHSKQSPIIRSRSGDAAAASLATGGQDWMGMKMDNIPLPPDEDEDDDDEEEEAYNIMGNQTQEEMRHKYKHVLEEPQQQEAPPPPPPPPASSPPPQQQEEEPNSPDLSSPFSSQQQHTEQEITLSASAETEEDSKQPPIPTTQPSPQQQQHPSHTPPLHPVGMSRPPKPEPRVAAPPNIVVPPPPGMAIPPADPNYTYQTPTAYNHDGAIQHPPSPSVASHYSAPQPRSPHAESSQNTTASVFATTQQQWVAQHDGFAPHSHADMPHHRRWSEHNPPPPHPHQHHYPHNYHHAVVGDSTNLRERLSSWGSVPLDPSNPPAADRRHSWGSGGRHAFPSIPPRQDSSDHSSHHSIGGGSHHSASHHSHHSASHRSAGYQGNAVRNRDHLVDEDLSSDEDESHDHFDEDQPLRNPQHSAERNSSQFSAERIEELRGLDNHDFRSTYQKMLRPLNRKNLKLGSPFANIGKKPEGPANRQSFFPNTSLAEEDEHRYPTFICPNCTTRQREFFSVSDAPKQLEGPTGYLAAYFVLYVTASLFIFGLEEGWEPLDCIYFAVISLTTAGLGDYVPTTDANKIICSIFIYFGVACIGLLLGSYIAGMLDDKAYTDAKAKQAESCPNCARIQAVRDASARRLNARIGRSPVVSSPHHKSSQELPSPATKFNSDRMGLPGLVRHAAVYKPRHKQHHTPPPPPSSTRPQNPALHHQRHTSGQVNWADQSMNELPGESTPPPPPPPPVPPPVHPVYGSSPQFSLPSQPSPQGNPMSSASPVQTNILGSPMTRQILGRQSHTRHASFDIGQKNIFNSGDPGGYSGGSNGSQPQQRKISETTPFRTPMDANNNDVFDGSVSQQIPQQTAFRSRSETFSIHGSARSGSNDPSIMNMSSEDIGEGSDSSETASVSTVDQIVDERLYKIKAAKYVFLTLREALGNSLVILAVGCVGFYLIENFTLVDSWYFTTVLLTTTGYGDIVPVTRGGKLFATIYLLVGGTILLNNMSMISMIPLELRKRRIERAVLMQFGDSLDDDALRELATGPLIKRLSLTADRTDGLAECTREMFALAMLVRLGKVHEDDIRQTFAAFRRLDLNNEGVLNSKSIIAGMIQRRRTVNPMFSSVQRDLQRVQQEIAHEEGQMNASGNRFFFGSHNPFSMPSGHGDVHFPPSHCPPPVQPNETSSLLHQTPNYGAHPEGSPNPNLPLQPSPPIHHQLHPTSPANMSPYETPTYQ